MSEARTILPTEQVKGIRELRTGVQADVYVGWSPLGRASLRIVAKSPSVQRAMNTLRQALVDEADAILKGAQDDAENRGRPAVGR